MAKRKVADRTAESVRACIESLERLRNQLQEVADAQPGFVRRVGNKAGELFSNATSMRRLVAAAQPLVKTLDEDQKREALTLARSMGFAQLAARFE